MPIGLRMVKSEKLMCNKCTTKNQCEQNRYRTRALMTKVGTGLGFHTGKTSFRTSEERFGSTEQANQLFVYHK